MWILQNREIARAQILRTRGPGLLVAETSGAISGLEIRAFALRDRAGHRAVLIEQSHSTADEGVYGSWVSFWRCTAAGCGSP
jgi:hypothetical protein